MATLGDVKIGLSAGAATAERAIEQAEDAEKAGFNSLWYPGAVGGDPLVQMALAGRATTAIELGTSVCRPTRAIRPCKRPGFSRWPPLWVDR